MERNQGISFHERLGSMKDYRGGMRTLLVRRKERTHADSPGNTLVLGDVCLPVLDFGSSLVANKFHPHILLSPSQLGCIDGDEQALDTPLFSVLNVLLGDVPVTVDVELDEEWLAWLCGIDDLVEGAGGEGWDHLDNTVLASGAGQVEFAIGVTKLA
jgi:hypothetical protein